MKGQPMDYNEFFRAATGNTPYPYQATLVENEWPDLLNVPTGLGKTAAVTLAWLYHRTQLRDSTMPRRLVWCLPMRVLVEQTKSAINGWLNKLELDAGRDEIRTHLLMGGEPELREADWAVHPDRECILIGTQDMLLSRALMRGYGMSRYQWPMHFGLLHSDTLWVFDEVQLMGPALATSAQLEAFRRSFPLGRESRSLWLSATLNPDWLRTVDLSSHVDKFCSLQISDADRKKAGERIEASKSLEQLEFSLGKDASTKTGGKEYAEQFVKHIISLHEPGHRTLVIVNRVDRAQQIFQALRKIRPDADDLLIHARFRPAERRANESRLASQSGGDQIVIATQAIEAGVDISSRVLVTELAPWSSLVQRFGRCNRYGEHNDKGGARIAWIDITDDAGPLPYETEQLAAARKRLQGLTRAGPTDLPEVDEPAPVVPVLRRKDLLDLFNTDPDLSGFDVDVSDYIRDTGQPGLQVFWRQFESSEDAAGQAQPDRTELCPVSIGQARALEKLEPWIWDGMAGRWNRLRRSPRPGMVLMLNVNSGGYDSELGFDSTSKTAVKPIHIEHEEPPQGIGTDHLSFGRKPVFLPDHLAHVASHARTLCDALGESNHADAIVRAGRWHDVGKAHAVFDQSMHRCLEAPDGLLAKSNCPGRMRHERPYFRHELASMLAWLQQKDAPQNPDPEVDLIAYLILAHHGKVRTSLRAMPDEKPAPDGARFARGVHEGDELKALSFDGEHSEQIDLRLDLMELGLSNMGRSWTERVQSLIETHGPFRLAWLETLVRIADWRASAAEQEGEQYD
jgi:CRISPR-associated endonuclease/helicase Cas3